MADTFAIQSSGNLKIKLPAKQTITSLAKVNTWRLEKV